MYLYGESCRFRKKIGFRILVDDDDDYDDESEVEEVERKGSNRMNNVHSRNKCDLVNEWNRRMFHILDYAKI